MTGRPATGTIAGQVMFDSAITFSGTRPAAGIKTTVSAKRSRSAGLNAGCGDRSLADDSLCTGSCFDRFMLRSCYRQIGENVLLAKARHCRA